MFEVRENACHSWDESGMWLVMMSASVFWTNHNLSQDTTLSKLLILVICRTLLANELSSSANLVLPKTSKMAMIRLQVESSENPIFLHQTPVTYVSDLFFLMWIFEKKNFKCTLNITTDPAYSTKRKVKRWDKKRKRKSCLTPASERIVPTEGPDLDVHPQLSYYHLMSWDHLQF